MLRSTGEDGVQSTSSEASADVNDDGSRFSLAPMPTKRRMRIKKRHAKRYMAILVVYTVSTRGIESIETLTGEGYYSEKNQLQHMRNLAQFLLGKGILTPEAEAATKAAATTIHEVIKARA